MNQLLVRAVVQELKIEANGAAVRRETSKSATRMRLPECPGSSAASA